MDYEKLAENLLEKMFFINKTRVQKKLIENMQGEAFVIHFISQYEGDVIPSEISNELGASSARIAAALNSLESKELVTRRIDTDDRRRILVNLTQKGKDLAEKNQRAIIDDTASMLKALGEHDAAEYVRIVGRVAEIESKQNKP